MRIQLFENEKNEFDDVIGFQWDEGKAGENRIAHNVDNWECKQPTPLPRLVIGMFLKIISGTTARQR